MRLTIYLFNKQGLLKQMGTFSVSHIDEINGIIKGMIPDYPDPKVWTEHKDATILKDSFGWVKTKLSVFTAERCIVIFYKGK